MNLPYIHPTLLGTRSLNVAVVTETFPPEVNGVAMTIERLVRGLSQRGHHVQVIRPRQGKNDSPRHDELHDELLQPGFAIPGYSGMRAGLPVRSRLQRQWDADRPAVVHIVTEGPLGWAALAAAQRLRIPVSTGFHTNFHHYSQHYGLGWLNRPISAYLRRFHNQSRTTLVPSDELRLQLQRAGYLNVEVVARGVDLGQFAPEHRDAALRSQWGAGISDLVAIHVGRLAAEKNLRLVADAFEAMRSRDARARMVWVGDGPERTALQARYPHHIFAGTRVGEDLARHYACGDMFLFASLTETFGNVTLEALASGLGVVAFDYAAAKRYIVHGRSGLLAPYADRASFMSFAESLACDRPRLARLKNYARDAALRADWEQVVGDFEAVLRRVAFDTR